MSRCAYGPTPDWRPARQPAKAKRQIGEEPEVPPQVILERDAGRPGRDVALDDRQAGAIGGQETCVAVPVVDRGEPADEPLRVRAHTRLPARDVAGVENN